MNLKGSGSMEDSKYAEYPLIDDKIENVECITNTSCIDGMLDVSVMLEKFRKKKDYEEICKSCVRTHSLIQ